MTDIVVTAGVALLAAAVVGGGLKLSGTEIPVISSLPRQVVAGLLGAALVIVSLYVLSIDPPPPKTVHGTITAPDGRVSRRMTATGQLANIPEGHHAFLLVEKGRFYPQGGSVPVLPDGTWSMPVLFGQSDEPGIEFRLHLVEAGPNGTKLFEDYFDRGEQTRKYPGFPRSELPSDVRFLDSVRVVRL